MRRLAIFIILASPACSGQTLDFWNGLTAVSGPAPAHRLAFTGGTLGPASTTGSMIVTGASTTYAANEPIVITTTGGGTALDWVGDNTDPNKGTALITSVVGNTINFTNHVSGTVSAATGFVEPARLYTCNVTTGYGQMFGFCDPLFHWIYPHGIGYNCAQINSGNCGVGNPQVVTSAAASAGVVTLTMTHNPTFITQGETITVSSCSDANYNGTFQVTTVPTATTITYADASAGASATGCSASIVDTLKTKYSDSGNGCTTANQISQELQTIGYNFVGTTGDAQFYPNTSSNCPGSAGMIFGIGPAGADMQQNGFSVANKNGQASQGTIFIHAACQTPCASPSNAWGENVKWNTNVGAKPTAVDVFSPYYSTFMSNYWSNTANTGLANTLKSPLIGFLVADDNDHQGLTNLSGWVPRGLSRGTAAVFNNALMMAAADPKQSFVPGALISSDWFASYNMLFPDNVLYTKKLSASAPGGCWAATSGTTPGGNSVGPSFNPCSWPDFVRNYYGTIAAVNTAWGTTYTTFDSSATVNTKTSEATGNGATSSYAVALGANVDIGSVQIWLLPSGGTAIDIAGDCPHTWKNCGGASGTGDIDPAPNCSQFGFTNVQLNFACVDTNSDIEVAATTAGSTGSGSFSGWPAAASCSGTQTTTWGITMTCWGPATSGAFLTYSTGSMTLSLANNLPNGAQLLVSWDTNGYGNGGTGLRDDDSSNTTIWGTNAVCLINFSGWQASHAYTAYDINNGAEIFDSGTNTWQVAVVTHTSGLSAPTFSATAGTLSSDNNFESLGAPVCGTVPGDDFQVAINMNQNLAAVLELWLQNFSAQYFKIENNGIKTAFPDELYAGTDTSLTNGFGMSDPNVMIGESAFTDLAFTGDLPYFTGNLMGNLSTLYYHIVVTYYKQPIVTNRIWYVGKNTNTSAIQWEDQNTGTNGCGNAVLSLPPNCFTTTTSTSSLVIRTQSIFSQDSTQLTLKNASGVLQIAGDDMEGQFDIQTSPFGVIMDNLGNFLDGHEDSTSVVSCTGAFSAFSCGNLPTGTPWATVDVVNGAQGLTKANGLAYAVLPAATSGPATKSIMMAKIDPAWIAAQTKYEGRLF